MIESATRVGLSAWLARLRDCEMPVFGRTVQELQEVVASESSSASALAQVILQDAAMTAKVLKLANSVWFNPGRQVIGTVSRAIVVLGFELVAQIAFSLALVDTLLVGKRRDRVTKLMAYSFHAAVQARAIAQRRHDISPEEVFVAALLAQIGEMAFWCFSGSAGDVLEAALRVPGCNEEEAQTAVLGFRLRQLTSSLAQDWKLGALARSVADGAGPMGSRERGITLAWALARAVEQGWDSPGARQAVKDLGFYLNEPVETLLPVLADNAQDAAQIASLYGASQAAALIPVMPAACDLEAAPAPENGPDVVLQLRILRDISLMIATRPNVSDLLQMVLEGIYRGGGMDRALLALLNPAHSWLIAKTALGADAASLVAKFSFPLDTPDALIGAVLADKRGYLIDASRTPQADASLWARAQGLRQLSGAAAFMIAPILADNRVVGVFYADRQSSARAISEEDYETFLHFVQQANVGFDLAAARGPR
jgi:hypothetical protein